MAALNLSTMMATIVEHDQRRHSDEGAAEQGWPAAGALGFGRNRGQLVCV
jgi:hypothetical protein